VKTAIAKTVSRLSEVERGNIIFFATLRGEEPPEDFFYDECGACDGEGTAVCGRCDDGYVECRCLHCDDEHTRRCDVRVGTTGPCRLRRRRRRGPPHAPPPDSRRSSGAPGPGGVAVKSKVDFADIEHAEHVARHAREQVQLRKKRALLAAGWTVEQKRRQRYRRGKGMYYEDYVIYVHPTRRLSYKHVRDAFEVLRSEARRACGPTSCDRPPRRKAS
jgi:hypothetical protein